MQLKELETWKSSCEKLTASLSRKEMELGTLMNKVQDLEEEVLVNLCGCVSDVICTMFVNI